MKLFSTQLGFLTILVGILMPISVLSHSSNRTKAIDQPRSILLAQVDSYRYLVDAANKEAGLADRASDSFFAAFNQLPNAPTGQKLKLTNVLIQTSDRAAVHLQRTSELGFQSLPYYASVPSVQITLDTIFRIQLEMAQIFRNYNQLSIQTRTAIQTNDRATVKVLGSKFAMLNERRAQLNQMTQQVRQASKDRSNAENAQLINNFNTQMRDGVMQRSRATKCMVSNLPYGSPAQIANNASGYCNSP
jgi:DTW domain-containing protein YfiP